MAWLTCTSISWKRACAYCARAGTTASSYPAASCVRTLPNPSEPFSRTLPQTLRIVDFGGLAVFENAKDTYVCVPLLAKRKQPERIQVARVPSLDFEDLEAYVRPRLYTIPHQRLTPDAWSLTSDDETAIFQKIMKAGRPLGDYVHRKFFRGVTTGLNEAFMIDNKTRISLIAKDRRSADLIKPLVEGEDARRWVFHNKDLWLIFTRRGIDIEKYPAIKEHLSNWKAELTPKRYFVGQGWS